jgi:hypothetical protein
MLVLTMCLSWRPVVEPPRGVDVPSSPSRTRSPKLTVMGETLADDVRTASRPRGRLRVGRPPRLFQFQGWRVHHMLLKRWARLLLGTSARRPLLGLLTSTPSTLDLLRTWCRTNLRLTRANRSRVIGRTGTSHIIFKPEIATS